MLAHPRAGHRRHTQCHTAGAHTAAVKLKRTMARPCIPQGQFVAQMPPASRAHFLPRLLPFPHGEAGTSSPGSAAAMEAQRGKCVRGHTHSKARSAGPEPPSPNPCPRAHIPYGRKGRGSDLPQHPEISTNRQATRQLVAAWHPMAPGDTRKERVTSQLLESLPYFPTPAAPGRTGLGRGKGITSH